VFSSFVFDVTRNAARSKVIKEVEQNAQLIMNRITNDIRHAQTLGTVSSTNLGLTMSPTLSVTYAFDSANNAVTYKENAGTATAISNNQVRVTGLSFSNTGSAITITISVAQASTSAAMASQYSTTLTSTAVVHSSLY
jgi:hypothetical protein